jgi:hypothetical protein
LFLTVLRADASALDAAAAAFSVATLSLSSAATRFFPSVTATLAAAAATFADDEPGAATAAAFAARLASSAPLVTFQRDPRMCDAFGSGPPTRPCHPLLPIGAPPISSPSRFSQGPHSPVFTHFRVHRASAYRAAFPGGPGIFGPH